MNESEERGAGHHSVRGGGKIKPQTWGVGVREKETFQQNYQAGSLT